MHRPMDSFPLLSLPALTLVNVVECLGRKDKLSLASSCRRLAMLVSEASQDTWVTVTPKTGLSKILGTNTITCNTMGISGMDDEDDQPAENRAVDMLLKPGAEPQCTFGGITKVCIGMKVTLPCLIPPQLPRLLPDLKGLRCHCSPTPHTSLQPIPYCSSLCNLAIANLAGVAQHLTIKYDTAEDLKRQLPNIDTLKLGVAYKARGDECVLRITEPMLQAWGDGLTKLVLDIYALPSNLQHCTRLRLLTLRSAPERSPITFLPSSLTNLHIATFIQESDLHVILQIPSLCVMSIVGFMQKLQQDWSNYPCTWQQLSVCSLRMTDLGKLPLQPLRWLMVHGIVLPDPLLTTSLPDVIHAAQCVSDAGLTVEGFDNWRYEVWDNEPANSEPDTAMSLLVQAASRVVRPPSEYCIMRSEMSYYPQTITTLLRCASPGLRHLHVLYDVRETTPWFWKALQCCSRLEWVQFSIDDMRNCIDSLSMNVRLAAEHHVAVTQRAMLLTACSCESRTFYDQAACQLRDVLQGTLHRSVILQECAVGTQDPRILIRLSPVGRNDVNTPSSTV